MPRATDPYSRVYWRAVDDPKFRDVWWDDRALATWLRLLVAADQAWPASAMLYHGIHRPSLARLVAVKLITVSGSGYRVKGLDAERERRKQQALDALSARGDRQPPRVPPAGDATDDDGMPDGATAGGTDVGTTVPTDGGSKGVPSQEEPRRAEKSQAEKSPAEGAREDDHLDAWYRLTGSVPTPKVTPWLDRLAGEYGAGALIAALAREVATEPDRRTLLSRTELALVSWSRQREQDERSRREEEAAKERERIASMPPETRKANLIRLRTMMAESGLLPPEGTS